MRSYEHKCYDCEHNELCRIKRQLVEFLEDKQVDYAMHQMGGTADHPEQEFMDLLGRWCYFWVEKVDWDKVAVVEIPKWSNRGRRK